jgi:hypothetical protein
MIIAIAATVATVATEPIVVATGADVVRALPAMVEAPAVTTR